MIHLCGLDSLNSSQLNYYQYHKKTKTRTKEVQTNNYIQKFRYNYKDKAHDNHTLQQIYIINKDYVSQMFINVPI